MFLLLPGPDFWNHFLDSTSKYMELDFTFNILHRSRTNSILMMFNIECWILVTTGHAAGGGSARGGLLVPGRGRGALLRLLCAGALLRVRLAAAAKEALIHTAVPHAALACIVNEWPHRRNPPRRLLHERIEPRLCEQDSSSVALGLTKEWFFCQGPTEEKI